MKESLIDQEALAIQVERWKRESPSQFFFRPYSDECLPGVDVQNNTILFCHQTEWQRDLLARYGRLCLLDATYKTTKYALPLFFLTVKTNDGYIVVGTFVVQTESAELISEALSIFSEWNPEWNPEFWMTDFSEAEINAIESTFPNSTVYLCSFHREQSWLRWRRKGGNLNVPSSADEIISMWRSIARSSTEDEYQVNLQSMFDSEVLAENVKAKNYFTTQWLPEAHRWVDAYHQRNCLTYINTNNGVESQNKVLKH